MIWFNLYKFSLMYNITPFGALEYLTLFRKLHYRLLTVTEMSSFQDFPSFWFKTFELLTIGPPDHPKVPQGRQVHNRMQAQCSIRDPWQHFPSPEGVT